MVVPPLWLKEPSSVVVLCILFVRFKIPFVTFACPSNLSLSPSKVTFALLPFTSRVPPLSTVTVEAASTVPPVTECLLPLRIENFPPVEFTSEALSEELFISSSPVFAILTVPPVILLSAVFNESFASFIFVVPPV